MNQPDCPVPNRRRFRHNGPPEWLRKRHFLFARFARFLIAAALLFLLGMGLLAFLLTRLFNGGGQTTWMVWLIGSVLILAVPVTIGLLAARTFARMANPLARIMAAADAVAEGDFSVRVAEMGPGEFGKMAVSFNRMVEELERNDRLRRNLTADVAHELRTPLHIIQGNLEGIQDGVYEPNGEQIDLLLEETHQLSRLVEDLRTISLAESGQLQLKVERVDVEELIQDVITSFSGQAETAGVVLSYSSSPGANSLSLMGDVGRLDQVLSNLIANALQHTPNSGKITLCAQDIQEQIRIEVSDTGIGIPPEALPFIFDRFWRSDRSRQGSTGLGLAIARQLIQAQGGSIGVESQPGLGTKFTIELPKLGDTASAFAK